MSEYELSLLRQRGLAARDSKAERGELRFTLPPGTAGARSGASSSIRTSASGRDPPCLRKFRELGSARQVLLWLRDVGRPAARRPAHGHRTSHRWRKPAYHSIVAILRHPVYAGAYAFGRRGERTRDRRRPGREDSGHDKPSPSGTSCSAIIIPATSLGASSRRTSRLIARERPHEEARGPQVRAWRSRAADRPHAVRPLWSDDAGVLRHAERPRPSLPVPRRRRACRVRHVRRDRRHPGRSGRRRTDPRGRCRASRGTRRCSRPSAAAKASRRRSAPVGRELDEASYEAIARRASLRRRVDPAKRHRRARARSAMERGARACRGSSKTASPGSTPGLEAGPPVDRERPLAPGSRPAAGLERRRDATPAPSSGSCAC